MPRVVYVDVLIVLNLMINYLLLTAASHLTGVQIKPSRAIFAAAVGAVGALVIFMPPVSPTIGVAIKLALCVVMVAVSSDFVSVWAFIRQTFTVLGVSFLFAGLMLAVYIGAGPGGMVFFNGIVYLHVPPVMLLLLTGISYAVVEVVARITRRRQASGELCRLRITANGRTVSLVALLDTGNNLSEPFSGLPVVVCAYRDVSAVLPDYILEYLESREGGSAIPGIRMVPFRSVGGRGALPAFRPDMVVLSQDGREFVPCEAYLAITLDPVGGDDYRAIVNPAVVSRQYNKVGEYV